jgi:hypothetical protein
MATHRQHRRAAGKLILVHDNRGLPWRVFVAIFAAE